LLDQDYFLRVESRECINDNFNQKRIVKYAPNISRIIDNFNNTSRWVVVTILNEEDPERRLQLLKHCIDISAELIEIHNFQTVMALGASFNANALFRLEQLWSQLDEEYIDKLEYLRELLDPGKKFRNLREASSEPDASPCIPYIGILLSDLSAVETVYDEKVNENLININKKRLSTKVMRVIQTYQSYRFTFERFDFLCEQLRNKIFNNAELALLDDKELLQMSLKLQPKK
jgi:son of sevenless-like protein